MRFFLDSILYSYAQIFFSNRRWFGAMVLAATFITPQMGMLALLGVIISNTAAMILKFDKERIRIGFYGFNGILFGAASSFYFQIDLFLLFIILIFIVITFFVSAVLENYMAAAFNLPGLSLPFIITLYIFIIFLSNYDFIKPGFITKGISESSELLPYYVSEYLRAMSLIVFQPNIFSGLLIALAVLIFSRVLFLLSVIAFTLNIFFIDLILPEMPSSYHILFSFNAILTAFALGGSLIIPSRKSFVLVIIATLMVVIMTGFFIKVFTGTHFPVLVLPFNFIVLSTIYSLKFRKENTELVLLYFNPGSPEENFYHHQRRKSRFERFKFMFAELPFFGEWFVSQGFEGKYTHKDDWKYAWDFTVTDEKDSEHSGEGKELNDYYCYKIPVSSPLDGEVVKVVDGIPDNQVGDVNLEKNWGNTIILKHEHGLFSSLSHLESGSIKVKEGDKVKKGEIVAQCGNSGRSPVPHLHFQFQATDKLGDKTWKFPFSNNLERKGDEITLKTFDYPFEETKVQNVDVHKEIKNALYFRFGDKLKFDCKLGEDEFEEEWEVKINMNNEFYIESSRGDNAGIYLTDKVFYFTNYNGKKNSALYYFYLTAMRIPFCFCANLKWNDEYSIDQLKGNAVRYLSELLLFYNNFISVNGSFSFKEIKEDEDFIISNRIEAKGRAIFSFYKKQLEGELAISRDGFIKEFKMNDENNLIFSAVNVLTEEEKS
jgi:urea transporter